MIQSTTSAALPTRVPLASLAVLAVLVVVAVAAGAAVGWAANPAPRGAFAACHLAPRTGPHSFAGPPATCIDRTRNYSATITTTKGSVGIVFLTATAPVTVNNFIALAVNGYFTGQSFFRSADWYVQGGDPTDSGRGGPGYLLPDEAGDDKWVPGALGMARLGGQGVSGSQFFITKAEFPGGGPGAAYNHFATVTVGFDVVQSLGAGDRILGVEVSRA